MTNQKRSKMQSAMEYLMTYGWAILVIAVILGALFQLGVFNTGRLGTSACIAQSGFICTSPLLNVSGNMSVVLGEIGTPITVTGVGCSSNSTQPSSVTNYNVQLLSNQKSTFVFQCPLTAHKIGTFFSGYVWITFTQGAQTGLVAKLASVSVPATTFGPVGTLPPTYFYGIGGDSGSASSFTYYGPLSTTGVSAWSATTSYPMPIEQNSCVTNGSYIYCVAGYNGIGNVNNVYYAPLTYPGIGSWASTSPFFQAAQGPDCLPSGTYIYCIYGSTVVYGQMTSTGIPSWSASSNSYPGPGAYNSCFATNGNIYCVGGGGSGTSLNYYAQILNPGIGPWSATTSFPVLTYYPSCAYSSGDVYCLAGFNGFTFTKLAYYAPVTGSGIGAWSATTSIPSSSTYPTCVGNAGYIYCLDNAGTEFIYGKMTGTGIPSWTTSTAYPIGAGHTAVIVN